MTEHHAAQRLAEIAKLVKERQEISRHIQALDKKISQLAGAEESLQRKQHTFTPQEFARGCGI